jgi:transcriptional regulator with XRE-family HTH domain
MALTTGAQLKAARALAGIEQEELARAAGVSPNTISRIERIRGEFGASVDTVRRLERALEAAGVVFTARGVELREKGPAA